MADAVSGTGYTFGGGNIDGLYTYDVKCTVTDAVGSTSTLTVNISSMGGFSIGLNNDRARFGGPVEEAGLVVDWDAVFKGSINGMKIDVADFAVGESKDYICPTSSKHIFFVIGSQSTNRTIILANTTSTNNVTSTVMRTASSIAVTNGTNLITIQSNNYIVRVLHIQY